MINGKNGIQMTPAICTQCGASLEVDPTKEAAVCSYCGTPFIVSKAINNYNVQNAKVEHVDSINIVKTSAIDSVLKFVDKQLVNRAEEKRRAEEQERQQRERKTALIMKYWWVFLIVFAALILLTSIDLENESSPSANKIIVGVSSSELEEKGYEEVLSVLKNAGFTNIKTETLNDLIVGWLTKDGEVEEVKIDGSTSFSSDSRFAYDAEIIVVYHAFPEQSPTATTENQALVTVNPSVSPESDEVVESPNINTTIESVYDYAYILDNKSYDIYYLIDTDAKVIIYFSTTDFGIVAGTYTGDFDNGIDISYSIDDLHEQIRCQNPSDDSSIILTDPSGFEWTLLKTSAVKAESLLKQD